MDDLIVHSMMTTERTDTDWMIEYRGGFAILEFKGFYKNKINTAKGQRIAYEKLHEELNQVTKCYLYIIGCDGSDFSNLDPMTCIFEIKQ